MNSNVNTIKLTTTHFEATVNVAERSFTIFGDFRTKEVYKLPKGEYRWYDSDQKRVLDGLINELIGLEDTIRSMLPAAEEEDVPWHSDASGS